MQEKLNNFPHEEHFFMTNSYWVCGEKPALMKSQKATILMMFTYFITSINP